MEVKLGAGRSSAELAGQFRYWTKLIEDSLSFAPVISEIFVHLCSCN